MSKPLAQHEMLEALEMMTFKNICVTKAATMSALVQDDELKSILTADATIGAQHIGQLKSLLEQQGGI